MKLREVATVPISTEAYSLYIRQREQANVQVFSLDYGEKLRVYDIAGRQKSARPWSSKVRCIAVGDLDGEGSDALVGGAGNRVLVVEQSGRPAWNIELESEVVACDARDVDGDDAAEIAVGLQNRRVILYNNDKVALFSRKMDNPIVDVWLEDITEDAELEVVVADRLGNILVLTTAGYVLRKLKLGDSITVFGVLSFGKRRAFVTGSKGKELILWDIEGTPIETIELKGRPRALATGMPDDVSDLAYIVVGTDDRQLIFWEVRDTEPISKAEGRIMQEMESTKVTLYRRAIKCGNCGAPALPETKRCDSCGSVLEPLDEYVTEECIKEIIDSVTTRRNPIKLRDLDGILRRTLARPATYHLRKGIQSMIEKREIEGYIDRDSFVRTKKPVVPKAVLPTTDDIGKTSAVLMSLLKGQDRFEIDVLESRTGVPREILRQTLMMLLGDGLIKGQLVGDRFLLGKTQDTRELVRKLEHELLALMNGTNK